MGWRKLQAHKIPVFSATSWAAYRENMGNQEVRPLCGREEVFVRFPEDRHQEFTDNELTTFARIHDPLHRVTVSIHVGAGRTHGMEADAQRLDPPPVVEGGGDIAWCPRACKPRATAM